MKSVGADRIVVEREPSTHAIRVLLPAVAALVSWGFGAWLGGSHLNLGPFGLLPTISLLWFVIEAVASFADGADRRVAEVGEDGVWLPETGYRPWTDFADVSIEPAAPITDIATLAQPRIPLPRRLGFTPRDMGITIIEPPAPRVARSIRRLRNRFVAVALRWSHPGAPLGIDEREIGRREFERLVQAIANEIPLGGMDSAPLTKPDDVARTAAAVAAGSGKAKKRAAGRTGGIPIASILVVGAIGVIVLTIVAQLGSIAQDEVFQPETEPPFVEETFPPEEPITPAPEVTEAPTVLIATPGPGLTMPPEPEFPDPTGAIQQIEVTGFVPDGVDQARLILRVNDENTCCAPADLTIYDLQYAEGDPAVPVGRWAQPFTSEGEWETYGDAGTILVTNSDTGIGMMVRVIAEDGQPMGFNAPYVDVTPGAPFTATIHGRVSPATLSAAGLYVQFLAGGEEVDRIGITLEGQE